MMCNGHPRARGCVHLQGRHGAAVCACCLVQGGSHSSVPETGLSLHFSLGMRHLGGCSALPPPTPGGCGEAGGLRLFRGFFHGRLLFLGCVCQVPGLPVGPFPSHLAFPWCLCSLLLPCPLTALDFVSPAFCPSSNSSTPTPVLAWGPFSIAPAPLVAGVCCAGSLSPTVLGPHLGQKERGCEKQVGPRERADAGLSQGPLPPCPLHGLLRVIFCLGFVIASC